MGIRSTGTGGENTIAFVVLEVQLRPRDHVAACMAYLHGDCLRIVFATRIHDCTAAVFRIRVLVLLISHTHTILLLAEKVRILQLRRQRCSAAVMRAFVVDVVPARVRLYGTARRRAAEGHAEHRHDLSPQRERC